MGKKENDEKKRAMFFRILKMYETLRQGKEIERKSFCQDYEISERTLDRDIEKIRFFLDESYSGYQVKYNSDRESYSIPNIRVNKNISFLEFSILLKILKGEQILEKNELAGMISSLQMVTERGDSEKIREIIRKEFSEYKDKPERQVFLKLFGDLQECILERNMIRIKLKEGVKQDIEQKMFCPVALEIFKTEFYLFGYQTEEDNNLTILRLEDIHSFWITSRKYKETVKERYSCKTGLEILRQKKKEEI